MFLTKFVRQYYLNDVAAQKNGSNIFTFDVYGRCCDCRYYMLANIFYKIQGIQTAHACHILIHISAETNAYKYLKWLNIYEI